MHEQKKNFHCGNCAQEHKKFSHSGTSAGAEENFSAWQLCRNRRKAFIAALVHRNRRKYLAPTIVRRNRRKSLIAAPVCRKRRSSVPHLYQEQKKISAPTLVCMNIKSFYSAVSPEEKCFFRSFTCPEEPRSAEELQIKRVCAVALMQSGNLTRTHRKLHLLSQRGR
jgi:hypothetical protein